MFVEFFGGPLDGQMREIEDTDTYLVPIPKKLDKYIDSALEVNVEPSYDLVEYRLNGDVHLVEVFPDLHPARLFHMVFIYPRKEENGKAD